MTRAEMYAAGYAQGCLWAEEDIRNRVRVDPELEVLESDLLRAKNLGQRRGYRETWDRYEAGTLTWEMFELLPIGGK